MIFGDQYSPKSSSFSATLTFSTILATSRSAFNKGELSREDDERSGDAAPHPGDHARTRDDLLAKQRGQQPVGGETTNVRSMNTALSRSIRGTGEASCGLTNWGRNAKKKSVSLGLRRLIR